MARTRGLRPWLSWVLAADVATDSGRPRRSASRWIFEPGLPRSTGLGPVIDPLFSRARWLHRPSHEPSRSLQPHPAHQARPDGVLARVRPESAGRSADARSGTTPRTTAVALARRIRCSARTRSQ